MVFRVLILDDLRSISEALKEARIHPYSLPRETQFSSIARNITEGNRLVDENLVYDLWILDNDLGINKAGEKEEGYEFLKHWINTEPDKVPRQIVCCSGNPVARKNIESLASNFQKHRSG